MIDVLGEMCKSETCAGLSRIPQRTRVGIVGEGVREQDKGVPDVRVEQAEVRKGVVRYDDVREAP